ncbi:class I SAM-dependent methyltransferase [Streptomyces sp. V4-01]|uniref:Class I SAM-dependent methyltransferase n=1 Tax=Actinacidiphila polyblastidii TaxID=3110430 RepID=A0ABU7PIA9_9ACTN|nr:class I SAM-dependent methyltransferase [Streptomyces sp. V4-01]
MPLLRDEALSSAFDHGSLAYDRLTALSPGYHAHLRRSARRLRLPHGGAGLRLLDLGCGTGSSTAALLAAAPYAEITAVDSSAGMLERAAAKPWPAGVSFVHAPVERLAEEGVTSGLYDAAFAAYLLRNVGDRDRVLAAVHERLAPGGRLALHEYALGGRAADRMAWKALCTAVVLPLGRLSGDAALYRHLHDSVAQFDTAPALGDRLRRAGFADVRVLPLPGVQTGLTCTVVGRTPSVPLVADVPVAVPVAVPAAAAPHPASRSKGRP